MESKINWSRPRGLETMNAEKKQAIVLSEYPFLVGKLVLHKGLELELGLL